MEEWSLKAAEWVSRNCTKKTTVIIAGLGRDVMDGMLEIHNTTHKVEGKLILNIPTSDHIDRALHYNHTADLLAGVDRFISVSASTANRLRASYDNVFYVPNYLSQQEIREQDNLPTKKTIAYFGRIAKRKRVDMLPVIAKKLPDDLKLIVQGPASYKEEDFYEETCRKLLEAGASVLEPSTTPQSSISGSIVFINPSEVEGLSIALLEAMNRGQIPILSNITENEAVIKDKSLLCEPDPDHYIDVIKRVFGMPEHERISLQQKMRHIVTDNFSEDAVKEILYDAIL